MISEIVIPVSPDDPDTQVLSYGHTVGAALSAPITVLSVLDSPQQRDQLRTDHEETVRDRLTERLDTLGATDDVSIDIRSGDPTEEIIRTVGDLSADLVVMGTHARSGLERAVLGSVAESVLRDGSVPVLAVPPNDAGTLAE